MLKYLPTNEVTAEATSETIGAYYSSLYLCNKCTVLKGISKQRNQMGSYGVFPLISSIQLRQLLVLPSTINR